VRFNTHDVRGITVSDLACAALVDALQTPIT
jgi:pterin-4a-carbinolamine dehydratase